MPSGNHPKKWADLPATIFTGSCGPSLTEIISRLEILAEVLEAHVQQPPTRARTPPLSITRQSEDTT